MSMLSCRLPEIPRNHTVPHIPESHTLYVGPSSCMRRHAIHAREYGDIEEVTFLRITQADVVSGSYEDLIEAAVGELLRTLNPVPRIMFIELFCIDDFLGTDDESLVDRLSRAFPDCRFVTDHIHPVATNETVSMSEMKFFNQYAFVERAAPEDRDGGINVIGAFVPINPASELVAALDSMGATPLRYLFGCKTFDEYQDMGKSQLALVTREMSRTAAEDMRARLGIPYLAFPACYDVAEIGDTYAELSSALGKSLPHEQLNPWRARAQAAVEDALEATSGIPLAIDCEASLVPHSLARALLDYGFNVKWIFRSKHLFDTDALDRERLMTFYPRVTIMCADDARLVAGGAETLTADAGASSILAIGKDAGHILGTPYCVDIWHDEGFTGYHGICSLMELMKDQALRIKHDRKVG